MAGPEGATGKAVHRWNETRHIRIAWSCALWPHPRASRAPLACLIARGQPASLSAHMSGNHCLPTPVPLTGAHLRPVVRECQRAALACLAPRVFS